MADNKRSPNVGVKIIKSDMDSTPFSVFTDRKVIEKSDKSEQLSRESSASASEWISHPVDMRGLKELVSDSTILPQCIKAYKNNIAGFGLSVHYLSDYDKETEEMKAEWTRLEEIIALLNMDISIGTICGCGVLLQGQSNSQKKEISEIPAEYSRQDSILQGIWRSTDYE